MSLIVSTTGATVNVPELGISITHPTTDLDLSAQFSADEIGKADSLTTAIRSGALTWKKALAGATQPATDYDSDFLDIDQENTGPGLQADRAVTFKDLGSLTTLRTRAGRIQAVAFTGTPRKATVTFATAFPDANYSVNVTGSDGRSWKIESHTAGGFVINSQASAALTGQVGWQAQYDGEIG